MIKPLMNRFPEIQAYVEVSVKKPTDIQDILEYAEFAVHYPSAPLVTARGELTKECRRVFSCIFAQADADHDGVLSDTELRGLEEAVFRVPFEPAMLLEVKKTLEKCPDGLREVVRTGKGARAGKQPAAGAAHGSGVTEAGFLFLQKRYAVSRRNVPWTILEHFGYDRNLALDAAALLADRVTLPAPARHVCELTEHATTFLEGVFERHAASSKAGGKARMAPAVLEALMARCGDANPWADARVLVECEPDARELSLEGWIALWKRLALDDPVTAASCLSCLG